MTTFFTFLLCYWFYFSPKKSRRPLLNSCSIDILVETASTCVGRQLVLVGEIFQLTPVCTTTMLVQFTRTAYVCFVSHKMNRHVICHQSSITVVCQVLIIGQQVGVCLQRQATSTLRVLKFDVHISAGAIVQVHAGSRRSVQSHSTVLFPRC